MSSSVVLCFDCDDPATHVCQSCDPNKLLCSFHHTNHQRTKSTINHQLITLQQYLSQHNNKLLISPNPSVQYHPTLICPTHLSFALDVYCETCAKCICIRCVAVACQFHTRIELHTAVQKINETVIQPKIKQSQDQYHSIRKQLDESIVNINAKTETVIQQLHTQCEKLKKIIDERERTLNETVISYEKNNAINKIQAYLNEHIKNENNGNCLPIIEKLTSMLNDANSSNYHRLLLLQNYDNMIKQLNKDIEHKTTSMPSSSPFQLKFHFDNMITSLLQNMGTITNGKHLTTTSLSSSSLNSSSSSSSSSSSVTPNSPLSPIALSPSLSFLPLTRTVSSTSVQSSIDNIVNIALSLEQTSCASTLSLWQYACSHHHSVAQWKMGNRYWGGWGVIKDDELAITLYIRSAEQGHKGSQSLCHWLGLGRYDENQLLAYKLMFEEVETSHDTDAYFLLGAYYDDGVGVEVNISRAHELYTVAASRSHAIALHYLGLAYTKNNGKKMVVDEDYAFKCFLSSAKLGCADGQYNAGMYYEEGRGGVVSSKSDALQWYKKSASFGHEQAVLSLRRLIGQNADDGSDQSKESFKSWIWWNAKKVRGGGTDHIL